MACCTTSSFLFNHCNLQIKNNANCFLKFSSRVLGSKIEQSQKFIIFFARGIYFCCCCVLVLQPVLGRPLNPGFWSFYQVQLKGMTLFFAEIWQAKMIQCPTKHNQVPGPDLHRNKIQGRDRNLPVVLFPLAIIVEFVFIFAFHKIYLHGFRQATVPGHLGIYVMGPKSELWFVLVFRVVLRIPNELPSQGFEM